MSHNGNTGIWGGSYFLGFLGAVIYYIQHAHTFWQGLWGVFEALFWPAFLTYHLFLFLKI